MEWVLYAWIKRGARRQSILKLLSSSDQAFSANDIKSKLKISLPQSSLTLKELSEKDLINCLNPNDNIGKLYKISSKGKEMIKELLKEEPWNQK